MSDTLYFTLKVVAAVVSGLYGFYATVTDFRVEKKGQTVLSRKGYFGLALLALATATSLSTDFSKENRDAKDAKATAEELKQIVTDGKNLQTSLANTSNTLRNQVATSQGISEKLDSAGTKLDVTRRSIEATAGTTKNVLRQTQRILDPITRDGLYLEVQLILPDQPAIRPYLERLQELKRQGHHIDQDFPPGAPEFPDLNRQAEHELARIANFTAVHVDFAIHVDGDEKPTFIMSLRGKCGIGWSRDEQYYEEFHQGAYPFEKHVISESKFPPPDPKTVMSVFCGTSDVEWHVLPFVLSWQDLGQTEMYVQVDRAYPVDPSSPQAYYYVSYAMGTQGRIQRFSDTESEPCPRSNKYADCFITKPDVDSMPD